MSGKGKKKSPLAKLLSLQLIFYWSMSPQKRCNPSIPRLAADLETSENTIRRGLAELEAIGEWVAIRGKGRSTTHYFPMFVENAKTHLMEGMEEEREARKAIDKERKAGKQFTRLETTAPVVEAPEVTESPLSYPEPVEEQAPTVVQDPKVKTERDAEIREQYLAVAEYKNTEDFEWETPLPVEGTVVDVIDVETAAALMNDENPDRLFVAGSEDTLVEELAGRWVTKFGSSYGPTHTYSHIQDVYDQLFAEDRKGTTQERIDATMFVLGSLGKAIDFTFIKAILWSTTPDENVKKLRPLIAATVAGRVATRRMSARNVYGNYGPASEATPTVLPQKDFIVSHSDVVYGTEL
jgi:hypothetical protein